MRKSQEIEKDIFAYILNVIHFENYSGVDEAKMTDKEKVQLVLDTFNDEFNYPYRRVKFPSLYERVADWLRGLPSCISIDFADYDILQLGRKWGLCGTRLQERAFVSDFFCTISKGLLLLAEKLGIDTKVYC